jgi:hypothetical protein
MPEPRIPADLLQRHWVHAHEEDAGGAMVFRPAGHPLPRARGRASFELRPGGALVEGGPGPTDRPERSAGTWRLADDGTLSFYRPGASTPHRVLRVESVAPDRLVVRKPP